MSCQRTAGSVPSLVPTTTFLGQQTRFLNWHPAWAVLMGASGLPVTNTHTHIRDGRWGHQTDQKIQKPEGGAKTTNAATHTLVYHALEITKNALSVQTMEGPSSISRQCISLCLRRPRQRSEHPSRLTPLPTAVLLQTQ